MVPEHDMRPASASIGDDDLLAFFGHNGLRYIETYRRGGSGPKAGYARYGFNWPAALTLYAWCFYRKLYLFGCLALFLPIVLVAILGGQAGFGLVFMGIIGAQANGVYFTTARSRIAQADKLGLGGQDRATYLARAGGVSVPAGFIGTVAFLLLNGIGIVVALHHGHRHQPAHP